MGPRVGWRALSLAHTTIGRRVSEGGGGAYRQTAEFPHHPQGPSQLPPDGGNVPWARRDWHDHQRPWDHAPVHDHELVWNPQQRRWEELSGRAVDPVTGERIPDPNAQRPERDVSNWIDE